MPSLFIPCLPWKNNLCRKHCLAFALAIKKAAHIVYVCTACPLPNYPYAFHCTVQVNINLRTHSGRCAGVSGKGLQFATCERIERRENVSWGGTTRLLNYGHSGSGQSFHVWSASVFNLCLPCGWVTLQTIELTIATAIKKVNNWTASEKYVHIHQCWWECAFLSVVITTGCCCHKGCAEKH